HFHGGHETIAYCPADPLGIGQGTVRTAADTIILGPERLLEVILVQLYATAEGLGIEDGVLAGRSIHCNEQIDDELGRGPSHCVLAVNLAREIERIRAAGTE